MVILAEQERQHASEKNWFNNAASASQNAVTDWINVKSFSVNGPTIIGVKGTLGGSGGGTWNGAGKITLDGVPVWSSGGVNNPNSVTSPDLFFYVGAGNHTVIFWVAVWQVSGGGWMGWSGIYAGQVAFNDMGGAGSWDSGVVPLTQNVNTTLINQTFQIPATRLTPLGNIANHCLIICIFAKDATASPQRRTHIKTGTNDAGKINIQVGGITGWSTSPALMSHNDDADGNASNPTYGLGSSAVYIGAAGVGATITVNIVGFTDQAGLSAECWAIAFYCPWFIPKVDHQPISLNFAQFGTFYAWLEPLLTDAVKTSKLGKTRLVSFGDATDFYSVASAGTGLILQHNYTFDVLDVPSCGWIATSPEMICISYIGVDAR
jgi:hypothetical protein